MKTPKEIVKSGYDRVSYAYREDAPDTSSETFKMYKSWIDELSEWLEAGSTVLDLGCGCGIPAAQMLVQRFKVTGADISPVQIERAKKLVPRAAFVCGDMCDLEFAPNAFDAITCLYVIIHVPLAEQPELLAKLWQWLKPGGLLMLVVGHGEWTGQEADWLGVAGGTMYWSHADRATYLDWLRKTGFDILWDRFIPEGDGGHTLIFAKKNSILPPPATMSK
ncbi:MAG: class I SAM-dependent methyltransferase [Anaerolineales bacterium]|nr:class I SAM-dependent methyltransferase [Anaerolineales bacterium]